MFCRIHKCYACEIGMCDSDFRPWWSWNGYRGPVAHNLPCVCMNAAFEPNPCGPDPDFDSPPKRFRSWVDRYGNVPKRWDPTVGPHGEYRHILVSRGQSRQKTKCGMCEGPGIYIPLCQYRCQEVGESD